MFWVPQPGDIGMGVSILSFNGNVQFGLMTDAALVPDPHAIVARFKPEFEQLLYFVLLHGGDSSPEEGPIKARAGRHPAARRTRRGRPRRGSGRKPSDLITPPAPNAQARYRDVPSHRLRRISRLLVKTRRLAILDSPNIITRPLAYSMRAMAECGLSFSADSKCFTPATVLRHRSRPPIEGADLVDHFSMVSAERDMCVGMVRFEGDCLLETCFDLAAQAPGSRPSPRKSLASIVRAPAHEDTTHSASSRRRPGAPRLAPPT